MPQLPSGLHVGLTVEPAEDLIRKGDFGIHMNFVLGLCCMEDMAPVVSLVYYKGEQGGMPTEPYLPGLILQDVQENRCGWSEADYQAFREWLASERMEEWLKESFKQLRDAISSTKVDLPKNLHGLLEG